MTSPSGSQHPDGDVVVGFAPDTAGAVLDHAARAARQLGCDIALVHVAHDPTLTAIDVGGLAAAAADRLRREVGPGTAVSVRSVSGPTVAALVEATRTACLLVVGSQHDAGVAEVVHRDVVAHVADQAACPVLVVHAPAQAPARARAPDPGPGDVTVGVSERDDDRALRTAFEAARASGRSLHVVQTWWEEGSDDAATDHTDRTARLRERLGAVVEALAEHYPDVDASVLVRRERPDRALVVASSTSSLVVLGRAPVGGITSTARAVLRQASCPVLVAGPLPPAPDHPDRPHQPDHPAEEPS